MAEVKGVDQASGRVVVGIRAEPREIAALHPHPLNYRRHPEHQLAILRESLRVHGQQKPVVITPDGTILAGHGLVEAAKLEGWETIACHVYDGPYPEAFLAQDDLNELLLRLDAEEKREQEEAFDAEQALAEAESASGGPTRVQAGEIWQLGRHRLLCGDATDPANWEHLMQGQVAQAAITDPPYAINYLGGRAEQEERIGAKRPAGTAPPTSARCGSTTSQWSMTCIPP